MNGPRRPLGRADLDADPLAQLRVWLSEAKAAGAPAPSSMVLCTVDALGRPSPRSIPLRAIDDGRLLVYTNLGSSKAADLRDRPNAVSALFQWLNLMRLVRIDATASILDDSTADHHFESRARQSQLNAWASAQSQVVESRHDLENIATSVAARFSGGRPIPRPPSWGVIALTPVAIEFWQAGTGPVHDRLRYRRTKESEWEIDRIGP